MDYELDTMFNMCLTRPTHAFHQLPELNIDTVKCTSESLSVYIDTLLPTHVIALSVHYFVLVATWVFIELIQIHCMPNKDLLKSINLNLVDF